MIVEGAQILADVAAGRTPEAKAVFNEHGIIVFPQSVEHRTMKVEGVFYEDDYAGNALAAMIRPGVLEIRYHKSYSDRRVAQIVNAIATETGFEILNTWRVTYQGRPLIIRNGV
ncbi:MAG: hypothetical protein JXB13_00385 [Phycisphaerae bacterium]|nr:hypothetical protein [Phycisphaerae bacterium]